MPTHLIKLSLAAALMLSCLSVSSVPASAQGIELTPLEVEIWNDPDFRRRFVESYIAETDLEPKPATVQEVEVINQTLALMRSPAREGEEGEDKAPAQDQPEQSPAQVAGRLQEALAFVLDARKDKTHSVLVDFLIANLYQNMALNLEEPVQPGDEQSKPTEAQEQAYLRAFEAFQEKRKTMLALSAQYYNVAVIAHPKYRRAWRNLGLVHVRMEKFDEARKAFARVIVLGGGDADTYGLLGHCYANLGNHLPAESSYRMANMLAPDQISWKMGLVRSFLLQKRYPDAVALCGKLLEDDPTNAQLWLFQANAYIGMDKIDLAAENYEILDGMGESSVDTVKLLADIYTNQGLYDTAVAYYIRAMQMAEGASAERLMLKLLTSARVLSTRGIDARAATKKLVEQIDATYGEKIPDPDRKTLLMIKARIALAEGAGVQEARILEEVVKLDPTDGEALILLGQFYARQQDWDEAIFRYERAVKLEGFEADALVRHAQALVQSDRAAEAVPLLRRSLSIKYREGVQQYLDAVERMKK